MVAVGCETEPVSNNDEFLAFAKKVLETVEANGPAPSRSSKRSARSSSASSARTSSSTGRPLRGRRRRAIAAYAHPPRTRSACCCSCAAARRPRRKVAMHIAAMKPTWIGRDDVPEETVSQEREIYSSTDEVQSKPSRRARRSSRAC
jgi:elongation factor Ts